MGVVPQKTVLILCTTESEGDNECNVEKLNQNDFDVSHRCTWVLLTLSCFLTWVDLTKLAADGILSQLTDLMMTGNSGSGLPAGLCDRKQALLDPRWEAASVFKNLQMDWRRSGGALQITASFQNSFATIPTNRILMMVIPGKIMAYPRSGLSVGANLLEYARMAGFPHAPATIPATSS